MQGILYCLVNDSMPGYVKIGMTTRTVQDRMKELYTTGVPLPFQCLVAKHVDDVEEKERIVHRIFSEYRVPNREFFQIPKEKVLDLFTLIHGTYVRDSSQLEYVGASRQGVKWGFEEQERLLQAVKDNVCHSEVAVMLERTPGAVVARLKYIAVNMILDGKTYDEAANVTKLPIHVIEEAMKQRKEGIKTYYVKNKPTTS